MVIVGNSTDGALVLEGEADLKDGTTVTRRVTCKIQDKGVREFAVVPKDSGETWAPAFDVLFLKHKILGTAAHSPATLVMLSQTHSRIFDPRSGTRARHHWSDWSR